MHLAIKALTTRTYHNHHFIYDLNRRTAAASFRTKTDDSGAKEKTTTKTTSSEEANEKEWHGHALVPAAHQHHQHSFLLLLLVGWCLGPISHLLLLLGSTKASTWCWVIKLSFPSFLDFFTS